MNITTIRASEIHTRCQSVRPITTREQYEAKQHQADPSEETIEQWLARKQQEQIERDIADAQNPNIRGFYDGCEKCGCAESQGAMFTTLKGGFICDDCL